MEFNTKELEFQRLWEEQQNLKAEIRGETTDCKMIQRENEMLMREIAMTRDEIGDNQQIHDNTQGKILEARSTIADYENRLRYANDIIL
jgi:hypothetical protein